MEQLSHIDRDGNAVMVDVGEKTPTRRSATATGRIRMNGVAFAAVRDGSAKKGDVLAVAQVAGIMAAKRTSEWIPLCHPLALDRCELTFALDMQAQAVTARCTVSLTGRTGVEMEALTGVSAALLTVYDMLKAVDRAMEIEQICLLEKQGGRSGHYLREE